MNIRWSIYLKWNRDFYEHYFSEDVETSPCPFSYAVSPPREVDDLSQIWPLPGICYVDDPQP